MMVVSQTPLRLSFFGGGTDIECFWSKEPGRVISSAIDKFVYVIVKRRFDKDIYLNYSKKEIVRSVDEVQHDLIREAMKLTGVQSGVEITTLADIPSEGSGLGSSSSITIGLLNALYAFKYKQVTAERLAKEACMIEIDILKAPIGKQDQYIAAYGGFRDIDFLTDGEVRVQSISINTDRKRLFGSNLLLFYTGLTRQADTILSDQKKRMISNHDVLISMRSQVEEMKQVLNDDQNLNKIGFLLNEAWKLKRKLSNKITNEEIEKMYSKAIDSGSLGGKISGAGGGGFLLLFVPREKQEKVRGELNSYREFPFMLNDGGSQIIFNCGSSYWL